MTFAKGRVWKRGKTWHYEVRIGDRLIFMDNTGAWRPVFDACYFDVAVADRVVNAGHHFEKTYDQLLDEARAW